MYLLQETNSQIENNNNQLDDLGTLKGFKNLNLVQFVIVVNFVGVSWKKKKIRVVIKWHFKINPDDALIS